ncbi:hypothetical protein COW36_14360 [bacterium (Candidatus Blackallbacteria) CG17_big_fil_post_rev_8_21_14_2_50_48_46]|uniref:Response regulatory domain-containing protein n=1 Tax=bacterium (Candidatus Blackallbacteria) CG17_big_fil_post_rev_8_21_14_2_50_48_46 TaxID=2014261 RepID=A0A2M7G2U3_9BACT|nr:MAG: hypothetical protein COW64_08885 [bacterium (Candidatus Blackallbacteria) CG18_big_fil_WC_8_21_14_2_50_49_26]PIW16144.1 MAG: hypothetical protein COW36_14360 [bacterium (Candidatus Blackallbacteria) CG17_big_fil_post_rev_8_21_14_2_50_48_46]PIW44231.1 MAG: hypothetical protein COW20_24690 [bacterium (Candidatus Blackallbacteria) CG13_big_fil_rev_8_21_14_2_50_49_14]
MSFSDPELQNYYRRRLQQRIEGLMPLYQTLLRRENALRSLYQILTGLQKAVAYPELVSLANRALLAEPQVLPEKILAVLNFLAYAPGLKAKSGTQIVSQTLRDVLAVLESVQAFEHDLAQLRSIAHALSGSGGTYGFSDISQAAKTVEHAAPDEISNALGNLILVLKRHVLVEDPLPQHRILLVQKDPDLRHLIQHRLHAEGWLCDQVSTASEVWLQIIQTAYAVIITDLVLPDLDGRRLVHELRLRPETSQAQIILLAGSSSFDAAETPEVDLFMPKPVDLEQLVSKIRQPLSLVRASAEFEQIEPLTGLPTMSSFLLFLRKQRPERGAFALFQGSGLSAEQVQLWVKMLRAEILPQDFPVGLAGPSVLLFRKAVSSEQLLIFIQSFQKSLISVASEFQIPSLIKVALAEFTREDPEIQLIKLQEQFNQKALEISPGVFMRAETGLPKKTVKRILLADDDPLIASILRFRIEQEGYAFAEVSDGDQVLPALQKSLPDLLILDLKMPGKDGFSVLKDLRQQYSAEQLPVMILTALGNESHVVQGLKGGANDFMTKPFSPEELISRMQRYLA